MILSAVFILLQAAQAQPPRPQEDELRIVAVEQTGNPPYSPEGRIYRLAGSAVSRINPGEVLVIKRPKVSKDIGMMRVISVHPDSVAATLEVRGETFPLKGDYALPLSSLGIPGLRNEIRDDAYPLKDIPFPLAPLGIPSVPNKDTKAAKTVSPPLSPKSLEIIAALRAAEKEIANQSAQSAQSASQSTNQSVNQSANQPAIRSKHVEQNPFYFLADSSALSPRGLERLKTWTQAWSRRGVVWFLAVPQKQLMFEELLVDRLTALQSELERLGVRNVQFRTDNRSIDEPYDVIYVGAEW